MTSHYISGRGDARRDRSKLSLSGVAMNLINWLLYICVWQLRNFSIYHMYQRIIARTFWALHVVHIDSSIFLMGIWYWQLSFSCNMADARGDRSTRWAFLVWPYILFHDIRGLVRSTIRTIILRSPVLGYYQWIAHCLCMYCLVPPQSFTDFQGTLRSLIKEPPFY